MKKGFLITNGLALFLSIVSIGWLVYDFIAFGLLHPNTQHLLPLTATDLRLSRFIHAGLIVFLASHIVGFMAVAAQFAYFRKASTLRIIALILGIFSCVMFLGDLACLSDIGNEYRRGGQAELEWGVLYRIAEIRCVCFLALIACLIEGFIARHKIRADDAVLKDEVLFTLIHSVGAFCGGAGLFFANAAFVMRILHPLLYFTFPILFVLTLIPYSFLAAYWLVLKLKERPTDWYDEKQFQDISKAGLISMFATVPYLAAIYILNYSMPKGPIQILWFPFYLYFVMLVFSLSSLYFSWKD
jgi:hypothetical protein